MRWLLLCLKKILNSYNRTQNYVFTVIVVWNDYDGDDNGGGDDNDTVNINVIIIIWIMSCSFELFKMFYIDHALVGIGKVIISYALHE